LIDEITPSLRRKEKRRKKAASKLEKRGAAGFSIGKEKRGKVYHTPKRKVVLTAS